MDLFESQVQVEVEKRLKDLVINNPEVVIKAYSQENKRLVEQLLIKNNELVIAEPKAVKWTKFLDADGFLDVSEIAEKIMVPYISPSGKKENMGRTYFCKLLSYDRILLHKSTGYGLYSGCPQTLKKNTKVLSNDNNGFITSSVKFNAKALEWLDDKYSSDERVWHSTSSKEIYFD